ncbi:MAG: DUF1653 domain-containing protein [Moraxella sp.]
MKKISMGVYRHYKGNLYQVLHIATHSETGEKLVVYRALYGDFGVWVRPLVMFNQMIEVDGKMLPRFTQVIQDEFIKPNH